MQANRLTARKSLRLDDAVTGGDLSRPGFRAFGGLIVFGDRALPVPFRGRDRLDPERTQPPNSRRGDDSGVVIDSDARLQIT